MEKNHLFNEAPSPKAPKPKPQISRLKVCNVLPSGIWDLEFGIRDLDKQSPKPKDPNFKDQGLRCDPSWNLGLEIWNLGLNKPGCGIII